MLPGYHGRPLQALKDACDECVACGAKKDHMAADAARCLACATNRKGASGGHLYHHGSTSLEGVHAGCAPPCRLHAARLAGAAGQHGRPARAQPRAAPTDALSASLLLNPGACPPPRLRLQP